MGLQEYTRADLIKIPPSKPSGKSEEGLESESEERKKSGFYISGGYLYHYFHYEETSAGNPLDKDSGNIPGFYGSIGYKSNQYIEWLVGKPFIEGYFLYYDAIIAYDGGTSLGNAFNFDEKQKVQRFGAKLGAIRDFSNRADIFGYLDVGKRIWNRGENEVIGGVSTTHEKYYWYYLGIGAGADYFFSPKLSAGIDVEWMRALDPKMKADNLPGITFNLKNTYGFDIKAPIKYYLLKNLSFDVTPYFTYWSIKRSDLVDIGGGLGVYEPDSQTHIEGLRAGFTYKF